MKEMDKDDGFVPELAKFATENTEVTGRNMNPKTSLSK
jgi:hypothetical protein